MAITGLEIPIVKLTVEHMENAILMALDQTKLSQQLEFAAKKALAEIDFGKMIQNKIYSLAEEVLQEDEMTEPIREWLSNQFTKSIDDVIPKEG